MLTPNLTSGNVPQDDPSLTSLPSPPYSPPSNEDYNPDLDFDFNLDEALKLAGLGDTCNETSDENQFKVS